MTGRLQAPPTDALPPDAPTRRWEPDWTLTDAPSEARRQTRIAVQRFAVSFEYPVCFTRDLFAASNPILADILAGDAATRPCLFAAFIDEGLRESWSALPDRIADYARHHPTSLTLATHPEFMPGGEACKNDPDLLAHLQRWLVDLGLDRHAVVVAIGGGALLDLVGYAAATVHRGLRLVRVPTTVLAQNDSGVGVKNGINGWGVKNLLGTFAPPYAVFNDSAFLETLSPRDKAAGMAEAVKVALIRDASFFARLETEAEALRAFRADAVDHMVQQCAALHMRQIGDGGDPFERGSARPLDFGHWAAHRLETLSDHALRHGEAVAIGIALDARYSVLAGLLAEGEDRRIRALLEALALPVWHPALAAIEADGTPAILRGLREFREHLGGALTITLLAAIGRGIEVHAMEEALILEAIDWLAAMARP